MEIAGRESPYSGVQGRGHIDAPWWMSASEAEATMMPWAEGDPALDNHIEKAVEYLDGYSSAAGGD